MILYLDTKDLETITVALKNGNITLDCISSKNKFGSQVLIPLINQLLKKNNLKYQDLTEVEVEEGPGSYTGLKIGAAVGQALGFALNIPVNKEINKPVKLRYT